MDFLSVGKQKEGFNRLSLIYRFERALWFPSCNNQQKKLAFFED